MSFDSLPVNVLVKIFDQFPFKERVRIRGVSRLFRDVSDQSINTMRSLVITDNLMSYTLATQLFSSLLDSCSPTLESIDASSYLSNKSLMKVMAGFDYPRLKHLKIPVIDNEQSKKMISGNLRSIVLHLRRGFDWPENMVFENLEHLEVRPLVAIDQPINRGYINLSSILRPLIGKIPNLKQISIKSSRDARFIFPIQELSQLMASAPGLERLDLELSGTHGQPYLKMYEDFEAAISTWRAPKLTTLTINFDGMNSPISPSIMHNFPYSFPRLKSFASTRIDEIDDQAIMALSHLENFRKLRFPYLQLSKEKFAQMVTSLPSITVLQISPGRAQYENPFQIDGQALQAMSQMQNLREFCLAKDMTINECIGVITSVSSIAILEIKAISDVSCPNEFIEFVMTAAQVHRKLEIRLSCMNVDGNEMELGQMEVVLKEMKNNGGPVVVVKRLGIKRCVQSIRFRSVVG